MANTYTYRGNPSLGPGATSPYERMGKFQAGSAQTVERGDIIELSGGNWIPLDADQAMSGIIAVAAIEITATMAAGYYPIYVPRPGDLWEYALAAAANPDFGADLYWSAAQEVTTSAGSNVLANVVEHGGFPRQQGIADVGDVVDRGTTIVNVNRVVMSFVQAASYYAALHG